MSYLLQNRRQFYETVLPRIPDQRVRKALEEINQLSENRNPAELNVDNKCKSLSLFELEDAFKKPAYGEKLGKVIICVHELLDEAIKIEVLCHQEFACLAGETDNQTSDYFSLRIERLQELRDSFRYHRFRLID